MKNLQKIALTGMLCASNFLGMNAQQVPPAIPSRLPSLLTPKSKPTSKIGSRK